MKIKHSDYLRYKIPRNWVIEEDPECTSLYAKNGKGVITLSFYTSIECKENIEEYIREMAKKFVEQSDIKVDNESFSLDETKKDKIVIYNTGITPEDNCFWKIWLIAKYPKIIIATYNCEEKTEEVEIANKIIDSFKFKNL